MCELELMRLLDDDGDGGLYKDVWRTREATASLPEHLEIETRIAIVVRCLAVLARTQGIDPRPLVEIALAHAEEVAGAGAPRRPS